MKKVIKLEMVIDTTGSNKELDLDSIVSNINELIKYAQEYENESVEAVDMIRLAATATD